MQLKGIDLIYFSPTGSSKKVAEAVASGIGANLTHTNLTPSSATSIKKSIESDRLTIFSVPVYGGRVPLTAIQRLSNITGSGTPSIVIVTYGNREFEDALLELRDTITSKGFRVIAGAAFIAEHSYSSAETPIAAGRPDSDDFEKAKAFGAQVAEKLGTQDLSEPHIPGNRPYIEKWRTVTEPKPPPISPETVADRCIQCGLCSAVCPTGSISVSENVSTKKEGCIRCTACVKICPTGARIWEAERIKNAAQWLFNEFKDRKENQIFI